MEVIEGMEHMKNTRKTEAVGWLDEMVKEKASPIMVIGIVDDGRVKDIDFWTVENMRIVDMRAAIQRVLEKIYLLEIDQKGAIICKKR